MLSFLKPRNASGYGQKDYKIANQYADLYREGDFIGAAAVLSKYGWDHDKANDVLNHFDPDGAAPAQPVEVDETPPEPFYGTETPEPTSSAVERRIVPVPATYGDSLEERAKLIAALWRKLGDGWQVESFDASNPAARTVTIVRGELPSMRPVSEVFGAPNATVGNGEAIAASHAGFGRTMLNFNPYKRQVETAVLPPATMELRRRLLRKNPKQKSWELELLPIFGVRDGAGYLSRVVITQAEQPTDRMKALAFWLEIARTVIGNSGWTVEMDDKTGRVELVHGAERQLPGRIPGSDLLPSKLDRTKWSTFVIGINSTGEKVSVDLQAGPHSLVVGGTGSGKSVALRMIILNALAKGFEVVIIDPTKQAAGLLGIRPWTKGIFIKDVEEAAAALDAIYREVRRRVDLITSVGGENWMDLPEGTVKPILVLLDEFGAAVTVDPKPVGIGPQDEMMLEWAAEAGARARIKSKIAKIAKEARSAGIHLVLSTQRPDAADIGGNVRENIGTIVQLVVPSRPPSADALRMVFPTDCLAEAGEEVKLLNDGRSKGFALAYLEGGGIQGFRVGLVEKEDMASYAEEVGIPLGVPLEIAEADPAAYSAFPQTTARFPAAAAPVFTEPAVVEHEEMVFSLDGFEEDEPAAPDTEVPAWAAAAEKDPEESVDAQEAEWAATQMPAVEPAVAAFDDEDPFAEEATPVKDDEDPFAEEVTPVRAPRTIASAEEEDPFAAPPKKEKTAAPVADSFWD